TSRRKNQARELLGNAGSGGPPVRQQKAYTGLERASSGKSENKASRNLPAAELTQCLIHVGNRASGYLATHGAGGSYCQNLPQILPGSHGGSLDADFSG